MSTPRPPEQEEHINGSSLDSTTKQIVEPNNGEALQPEPQMDFSEISRSLRDCARQIADNSRLMRESGRQAQLRFMQHETALS